MRYRVLDVKDKESLSWEMGRIGVHPEGIKRMIPKTQGMVIKIKELSLKQALVMKQEALSCGCDLALPKEAMDLSRERSDALLIGTKKCLQGLIPKLRHQYFGLGEVAEIIEEVLKGKSGKLVLECCGRRIELGGRPHIMGILNVTPDSFYDGGQYMDLDRAVERAIKMEEDGADIIDVGGESSRPGSEPVDVDEELRRVIPVLERISGKVHVPLSVDTWKARVAREAIQAGAVIVNDISSFSLDPEIKDVVSDSGAGVILMHMKGVPKTMQEDPFYDSVMDDLCDFFWAKIEEGEKSGISHNQMIIDPGIGFGKRLQDNLQIIRRLGEFKVFGRPILVGPSRKSFIGNILGVDAEGRLFGTAASVAISVINGANIVRVHDVREMKDVVMTANAISSDGGEACSFRV